MQFTLYRTYHPQGTNGSLYCNDVFLCHTIELPWLDNKPQQSCIPEGRYVLQPRWSVRHRYHLQVLQVPGRSLILLHPANDAAKELQGCIAPVTVLTAPGRGLYSRRAFDRLMRRVAFTGREEPFFLTIQNTRTP